MSGSMRLYGGHKAALPSLAVREPGWCVDTQELYIGAEGGNVLAASAKAARGELDRLTLTAGASLAAGQMGRDVAGEPVYVDPTGVQRKLAFRAAAVASVDPEATTEQLAAALNALLTALKAGKVMEVNE